MELIVLLKKGAHGFGEANEVYKDSSQKIILDLTVPLTHGNFTKGHTSFSEIMFSLFLLQIKLEIIGLFKNSQMQDVLERILEM